MPGIRLQFSLLFCLNNNKTMIIEPWSVNCQDLRAHVVQILPGETGPKRSDFPVTKSATVIFLHTQNMHPNYPAIKQKSQLMLPLVAKICSTNHSADKIFLNMDFFFFFNENKPQTTQPDQAESKVNSSHIRFKFMITLPLLQNINHRCQNISFR